MKCAVGGRTDQLLCQGAWAHRYDRLKGNASPLIITRIGPPNPPAGAGGARSGANICRDAAVSKGWQAVIRSSRPWLVEVCENPSFGSATAELVSGIVIDAF